jgi:hypothetical protein
MPLIIVISLREGLKIVGVRDDAVMLERRNGMVLTVTLPWESVIAIGLRKSEDADQTLTEPRS